MYEEKNSAIDIRFLDVPTLVYNLWVGAKKSPYLKHYDLPMQLDIEELKHDIMCMDKISFTIYHGKVLLVELTDTIDVRDYNFYNGKNKANSIINDLKNKELSKLIVYLLKYH